MPLMYLVLLPFIGSLLAAVMPANARNAESTLAGLIALFCAVQAALCFPAIAQGGVLQEEIVWLPALGLNLVIRMDGFAWMFCMLILGIGALVVLYARYYMSPSDPVPRFFSFLLAFMGSMVGVVLSGNIIQLAFFWELTSLFSFLLIGYWHHRKDARRGARMALTVTGTGGLCMLAGMLVIGHIVGSYDLDQVLAAGPGCAPTPLYFRPWCWCCWAHSPKARSFLSTSGCPMPWPRPPRVRLPAFGHHGQGRGCFCWRACGRCWAAPNTVLAGGRRRVHPAAGAVTWPCSRTISKGLLAYSTISHLGLITLLLGPEQPFGRRGRRVSHHEPRHLQASLFMAAGIMDHETGTRDIRRLSGLRTMMPITATLAMVASASMAGVLLNGSCPGNVFAETVFLDAAPGAPGPAYCSHPGRYFWRSVFTAFYRRRVFRPCRHRPARQPHEPPLDARAGRAAGPDLPGGGMLPAWSVGPFSMPQPVLWSVAPCRCSVWRSGMA